MIQRVIGKIADGEIHSAEMVHRISQIVREQGHALSDMIYPPGRNVVFLRKDHPLSRFHCHRSQRVEGGEPGESGSSMMIGPYFGLALKR